MERYFSLALKRIFASQLVTLCKKFLFTFYVNSNVVDAGAVGNIISVIVLHCCNGTTTYVNECFMVSVHNK